MLKRLRGSFARKLFQPRIEITHLPDVERLGTDYGLAFVRSAPSLRHATIISCGLGEDASFDVEFLRRYGGRVILVDPTPRAKVHYNRISARFGRPAEQPFTGSGCESPAAYDLCGITAENLILDPVAVWSRAERVKFFCPPEQSWVSHSITNPLNGYRDDTPFIEVPADTIDGLMKRHRIDDLVYLKLDIEGAEIPVLKDMLRKRIRPKQIHVGFDDAPTAAGRAQIEATDEELRHNGYVCCHGEDQNYLYVQI